MRMPIAGAKEDGARYACSSGGAADSLDEVPLEGGWVTTAVVRVGETVRRPVGAHSPFVHALLRHLEGVGFDGAPKLLGIDNDGREIISFLHGTPYPGTTILSDDEIESAADLLRRYHDAAATLPRHVRDGAETVIHGDPGPWNILWMDRRASALIDFDEARPGSRLEDLGYFAWKGLQLGRSGPPVEEQRRRLAVLCAAYPVPVGDDLLDAIEAAVAWLHAKGSREGWEPDVLAEIEGERRWQRVNRARLRAVR